MFRNILLPSFSGVVSRRTYWLSVLIITALSLCAVFFLGDRAEFMNFIFSFLHDTTGGFAVVSLMAIMPLIGFVFLFVLSGSLSGSLFGLLLNIWILYAALLLLGLQVRRLRGRNKSSLYTLLPFIPVPFLNLIGLGYLIYLLSSNSKEEVTNNDIELPV